jgi:hypothetical protein
LPILQAKTSRKKITMKSAFHCLRFSVSLAVFSAGFAFTPTPANAAVPATTAAPVAYVYVQTLKGVNLYDVASNGTLTLVSGSPFKTTGELIGSTGTWLFSLGTSIIHSYPVASNGAIKAQSAQIDTASYEGGSCGQTMGGGLDHTGQYVQVSFQPSCGTIQTYKINKSNGALTFLGGAIVATDYSTLGPLTNTANNKFAYAALWNVPDWEVNFHYMGFVREANGALADLSFSQTDPNVDSGQLFSWLVTADPTNHLAIALGNVQDLGSPIVHLAPTALASYTVDANGNIASTNTQENMPVPAVGPTTMRMSPSGKFLAVAGGPCNWCVVSVKIAPNGLEVFNFNGASPITPFSKVLTTAPIDQIAWDNSNHLFAVSDSTNKLYVYTVTSTGVTAAPGSPYTVTNPNGASPYGLVVVPK